jgi:hypothetical protein
VVKRTYQIVPCLELQLVNFDGFESLKEGRASQCKLASLSFDVAFAQIAHPQLFATKDIQRQKAKVVVKTVEVATLLQAVHPIVGTVKIRNQLAGSRLKAAYELFEEHLVHQPGFFAASSIL